MNGEYRRMLKKLVDGQRRLTTSPPHAGTRYQHDGIMRGSNWPQMVARPGYSKRKQGAWPDV